MTDFQEALLQKRPPAGSGLPRWTLPYWLTFTFLFICGFHSHYKLLWGDEYVTYWVGQQRSFHGIWTALGSGADPNPPLMHVLDWWATAVLGSRPEVIRMPSILGVALGMVSLWALLRRYFTRSVTTAGCLALMTTRGFDYAYDARSYGLLLGFSMAALAAWELGRSATGRRRFWWLAGLAAALACGVSSNYYGVLAFFPVAVGEVVASVEAGRIRLGAWVAMVVGALPLLAYLKLIRLNIAEFGPHAWNKPSLGVIPESYFVLVEGVIWPLLGMAAFVYWRKRRGYVSGRLLPKPMAWAMGVLLVYPVLGFVVAYCGAGMISARCVIPVCAGVAMMISVTLAKIGSRRVVLFVLVFLSVWVMAREIACAVVLREQRAAFLHLRDKVEQAAAPGEKVVVGDSLVVMPLYWYGSPELRESLVFPVDFAAIHRTEPDDSGEQNLWSGRHGVFPVPIDVPEKLIDGHHEYVFVGTREGWLGKAMAADGFALREDETNLRWNDLGGVFTPLAHPATRIYFASPADSVVSAKGDGR